MSSLTGPLRFQSPGHTWQSYIGMYIPCALNAGILFDYWIGSLISINDGLNFVCLSILHTPEVNMLVSHILVSDSARRLIVMALGIGIAICEPYQLCCYAEGTLSSTKVRT